MVSFRSRDFYHADTAGFDNLMTTVEADCRTMRATIIRSTYLRGDVKVGFGGQLPIADYSNPDAGLHWVLARLCGGRMLSGEVEDPRSYSETLFKQAWAVGSSSLDIQEVEAVERTASASLQEASIATSGK